jgi:two-component system, OmpR family, sensor histidine kinase BaeS
MKLRLRLSVSFLAVAALASIPSAFLARSAVERLFRSYIHDADEKRGSSFRLLFEGYYHERGTWDGVQEYLMSSPAVRARTEDRVVLVDGEGRVVADDSGILLGSLHAPGHLAQGIAVEPDGVRRGTLLSGSMADPALSGANENFVFSLTAILLWAGAISAAASLALGLVLSAGLIRPLARLGHAASRVAAGDFETRVEARGSDELGELGSAFNAMAGELAKMEESKRRVIADAAHELRTPATLIRGTVEAILDGVYEADRATLESLHEETLRLCLLIEDLRELEVMESGRLRLDPGKTDLVREAAKAMEAFQSAAAAKGIRLELADGGGRPEAICEADAARIGQVLRNLLSNALAQVPRGGISRISAGTLGDGRPYLRVEDSGPGIPPEDRERVFERFFRIEREGAGDEGGRGIGLAIAREIMKAHGGSLEAGESEDLGGAAFTAAFPRKI